MLFDISFKTGYEIRYDLKNNTYSENIVLSLITSVPGPWEPKYCVGCILVAAQHLHILRLVQLWGHVALGISVLHRRHNSENLTALMSTLTWVTWPLLLCSTGLLCSEHTSWWKECSEPISNRLTNCLDNGRISFYFRRVLHGSGKQQWDPFSDEIKQRKRVMIHYIQGSPIPDEWNLNLFGENAAKQLETP